MTGQTQTSGFDFNHPTVVSLLYLGGFITGVSAIVGLILAYVWKGEPHAGWEESHFQYLIRTFWIALGASVIAGILAVILIGFLLFPLIAIWFIVRCVKALLAAQKREPMPDPTTWMF
ncbi:MAG: DUF4870 family protein [Thermaurantiacus sp.]